MKQHQVKGPRYCHYRIYGAINTNSFGLAEKRSTEKVRFGKLPDVVLREPCQVYCRVYKKEGAMPSRTPFDPDDDTLRRVVIPLITAPHTVISLNSWIVKAECMSGGIGLSDDMDGEVLMSDDNPVSCSVQTYPGYTETS